MNCRLKNYKPFYCLLYFNRKNKRVIKGIKSYKELEELERVIKDIKGGRIIKGYKEGILKRGLDRGDTNISPSLNHISNYFNALIAF